MHLIAGLRDGDDVELAQRARAIGIAVEPLSQWYLEAKPRHGLVLGFTNIATAEQAATVALRLAQVIPVCAHDPEKICASVDP